MISIRLVSTLEELTVLMPFFLEGFYAMEHRQKVFEVDKDGFIKTLVGVLNTTPKNGILVAFDGIDPVGYGVAFDDTPAYGLKKELLLWALYVKPQHSKFVAPMLFQAAEEGARERGYDKMKAFNSRFSGASYRFFEQLLGMRRNKIQFTKDL
jgi:hypothetical protein